MGYLGTILWIRVLYDARNFIGKAALTRRALRRNNLIAMCLPLNIYSIYFTRYEFLTLTESRNIDVSDELFRCYSRNHDLK